MTISAGKSEVAGVNELERVDGKLYGNIFTTRAIVRFDPADRLHRRRRRSRRAVGSDDARRTRQHQLGENVLNGIAYDPETGLFYLTGKRWRAIFVGRFRDQ